MKIIETHHREKGFVLWGHCHNILDDPRIFFNKYFRLKKDVSKIQFNYHFKSAYSLLLSQFINSFMLQPRRKSYVSWEHFHFKIKQCM